MNTTIVTICGCGLKYTLATFRALRTGNVFRQDIPAGADPVREPAYVLESRPCVCHSHCSIELPEGTPLDFFGLAGGA